MASILTPVETDVSLKIGGTGRDGSPSGGDGSGGGRRDGFGAGAAARAGLTGMWLALAAILMMFAAFSSAMIVRKGLSNDWEAFRIPSVLWVNTLVLAASSVTLEVSRRSLASANHVRFAGWWYVSAALGLSFLLGQLAAWRELAARGVYLATNPAASFFYLLTAAHGLHLLGGVAGLIYVALRAGRYATAARSRTAVDVAALYWHFMDGLWVYLLALLLLGR